MSKRFRPLPAILHRHGPPLPTPSDADDGDANADANDDGDDDDAIGWLATVAMVALDRQCDAVANELERLCGEMIFEWPPPSSPLYEQRRR